MKLFQHSIPNPPSLPPLHNMVCRGGGGDGCECVMPILVFPILNNNNIAEGSDTTHAPSKNKDSSDLSSNDFSFEWIINNFIANNFIVLQQN